MSAHAGMVQRLLPALNGGSGSGCFEFGQSSRPLPGTTADDGLTFLDELTADLDDGAYDFDDLLLDDLQLPAAGARAASTTLAVSDPGVQAHDRKLGLDLSHAVKPEPCNAGGSQQVSVTADARPGRAWIPHPESSPAQSPPGFVPVSQAAVVSSANGMLQVSSPPQLPALGSAAFLPAPSCTGAPERPRAPLTTSQQHQLLMDFLAQQEARSHDRWAQLQRQQAEIVQQTPLFQVELPPGRQPMGRRLQPVASPFKQPETREATALASKGNRLQQRERRQVRVERLKNRKQRGFCGAVLKEEACNPDEMMSDDEKNGYNDGSQNSGRSSPDGLYGPQALQSLSSGGSLSMQDLVLANGGGDDYDEGLTEETRKEQSRARNRVAQRRYRYRQREKLQEKEDKLAVLSEQLAALTTEKETLAARNELLEQFLHTSKGNGSPRADVARPGDEDPDTWLLDGPTRRLLQSVNDELAGRIGCAPGCTVTVSACGDYPRVMTSTEVASLPLPEFDALWREYVAAFGELMRQADRDAQSPAAKQMARLTVEAQMLKGFVAMTHPSRVTNAQNLEIATGSPRSLAAGAADVPSWSLTRIPHVTASMRRLVAELNFTPAQRRLLVALRKLYLRNLGVLARRRQHLAVELQDALAMPLGDEQAQVAEAHNRTTAVMGRLRATMRDEHSFLVQLRLAMGSRVLTPIQFARVHLDTYPAGVDVVALSNCVAEGMGEPLATDVLQTVAASEEQALVLIYDNENAA